MLLSELETIILCESGQFIVGDLSCLNISRDLFFRGIVKRALQTYERYRPLTREITRTAIPNGRAEALVFFQKGDSADDLTPGSTEIVFDGAVGDLNRDPADAVPQWISRVSPVNVLTTAGILYLIQETRFANVGEQSVLHEPRAFLWKYEVDSQLNNGILYVTETGRLDITAHYRYPQVEIIDSAGQLVDVDMQFIEEGKDEIFIDLVLAKFLQKVGRSRRAFQLNDLPITYDATELVAEGSTLEAETRERLYEQSNWYEGIGN